MSVGTLYSKQTVVAFAVLERHREEVAEAVRKVAVIATVRFRSVHVCQGRSKTIRGDEVFLAGRSAEGLAAAQRAVDLDSESILAHFALAYTLYFQAVQRIRRHRGGCPRNVRAKSPVHDILGIGLRRMGQAGRSEVG
jgi:hypothetical protein